MSAQRLLTPHSRTIDVVVVLSEGAEGVEVTVEAEEDIVVTGFQKQYHKDTETVKEKSTEKSVESIGQGDAISATSQAIGSRIAASLRRPGNAHSKVNKPQSLQQTYL
jgi:hypothetical protein